MKGLSTILAMILIVIIVVALVGLTYTFLTQMFQASATGATNATQYATQTMQKTVDVISATCSNTTTSNLVINFTMRASGIALSGETGALLDGIDISTATYFSNQSTVDQSITIKNVTFNAGQVKGFSYSSTTRGNAARTLTVTAPAGDDPVAITCPT